MKPRFLSLLVSLVSLVALPVAARGAATFDDAIKAAKADYAQRLQTAAAELNAARERIAGEKAPVLQHLREAENRIIAAESAANRLTVAQEGAAEQKRKSLKDLEALRKTQSYLNSLAHDHLKAARDGLAPGEEPLIADQLQTLQDGLDDSATGPNPHAAVDVAEFLFQRTRQALGGHSAPGRAMIAETNVVVPGTFAFAGPETFFRPDQRGTAAGTVRARRDAAHPVSHALPAWKPEAVDAFFAGRPSAILADASGGKALRLRETTGSVWLHIKKGGYVAYAILVVGLVALLMILQKIRDLLRMGIESPETVRAFLAAVAAGSAGRAEQALAGLKGTTRELFSVGLQFGRQPRTLLEEHLQAVLLQQRLHFERRLPLLAVIATAAPLMGLLGTVVGMVKTFALITVFGTGNAAKLSSGISEVLVATELGLAVAIPTLVAHGFLAHRIQKNLSLLERQALQFVTAAETAKVGGAAPSEKESVNA